VLAALLGMGVGAEAVAIDGAAERRMIGGGDRLDSGKRTQRSDELGEVEAGARCVVAGRDAGAVDVDTGHEQVIGLEAERLMEQGV